MIGDEAALIPYHLPPDTYHLITYHLIKELPGGDLSFRRVTPPVLSALGSFTSVFGKGTGGATPLEPPGSLIRSEV